MESQHPTSLPNAGVWKIACPTPSCTRLLILPPGSNELPPCQHCSQAELAKEAAFASRVAVREREQELMEYRRERRGEGSRSWRRGVKEIEPRRRRDGVKGEKDGTGEKGEDGTMARGPKKTAKEVMKERNEKMRAAAAAGRYAGTSNEAMSRYESVERNVKTEPEEEVADEESTRRGSRIISGISKAANDRRQWDRVHRRSNSYNSLFYIKTEDEEPKTLKRTRDDTLRSEKRGLDNPSELFPEKTRTKSRSARGRRGHDSGYAAAPSSSIKRSSSSPSPSSSSSPARPALANRKTPKSHNRHTHRRSPLRSPSALRRGVLRRARTRVLQPLPDPPETAIKHEDEDEEGEPAVQPRPGAREGGKRMMSTIDNILRQHPNLQVTRTRRRNEGKELLSPALPEAGNERALPVVKTEDTDVEPVKKGIGKAEEEVEEEVDYKPRRRSESMKRRAFLQGSIGLALLEAAMPAAKKESEEEEAPKGANDGSSVSVQLSEKDSLPSPKVPRSPATPTKQEHLARVRRTVELFEMERTEGLSEEAKGLKHRTCDP